MKSFVLFSLLCYLGTVTSFSTPTAEQDISADLTLGWVFTDSDVNLIIEKKRIGHAVIGLGTSLDSGDVILIETANGILTFQDCYLAGYGAPICTEAQDWKLVDQTLSTDGFKIELTRAAEATDQYDRTYS